MKRYLSLVLLLSVVSCGGGADRTSSAGIEKPPVTLSPRGTTAPGLPGSDDTITAEEMPSVAECFSNEDCTAGKVCNESSHTCGESSTTPASPSPSAGCEGPKLELRGQPRYGVKKIKADFAGLKEVFLYGNLLEPVFLPDPVPFYEGRDLLVDQNGDPVPETTGKVATLEERENHGFDEADYPAFLPVMKREFAREDAVEEEFFHIAQRHQKTRLVLAGRCPIDDSIKTVALEIVAPAPAITVHAIYADSAQPVVQAMVEVRNALTFTMTGTGLVSGETPLVLSSLGGGTKLLRFQIKNKETTLHALAIGIGNSIAEVKYLVKLDDVSTDLEHGALYDTVTGDVLCSGEDADWRKTCHKAGKLSVVGSVERTLTISRETSGGALETEQTLSVPWVQDLEIRSYSDNAICGTTGVLTLASDGLVVSGGKAVLQAKLPRTHRCFKYSLLAHDLNGDLIKKKAAFPYAPIFETPEVLVLRQATPQNQTWDMGIRVRARNVKEIRAIPDPNNTYDYDYCSKWKTWSFDPQIEYEEHNGYAVAENLTGLDYLVHWKYCLFEATAFDGQKVCTKELQSVRCPGALTDGFMDAGSPTFRYNEGAIGINDASQ